MITLPFESYFWGVCSLLRIESEKILINQWYASTLWWETYTLSPATWEGGSSFSSIHAFWPSSESPWFLSQLLWPLCSQQQKAVPQRTDTAMELLLGHPNARLSKRENKSGCRALLQSQDKFWGTFIQDGILWAHAFSSSLENMGMGLPLVP